MFTVRRHHPMCGWMQVLCEPRETPGWRYSSEMWNGHCPVLRFATSAEADRFAAIYRGVTHLED